MQLLPSSYWNGDFVTRRCGCKVGILLEMREATACWGTVFMGRCSVTISEFCFAVWRKKQKNTWTRAALLRIRLYQYALNPLCFLKRCKENGSLDHMSRIGTLWALFSRPTKETRTNKHLLFTVFTKWWNVGACVDCLSPFETRWAHTDRGIWFPT